MRCFLQPDGVRQSAAPSPRLRVTSFGISGALVALLAVAAGCQRGEQIQSFTVAKENHPNAALAEPTDRMLTGIVPVGGQAWFLKIIGPIAELEKRDKEIAEFFASVRVAPGQAKPDWTLPEDWTEKPASGLRVATIMVPAGEGAMELTVIPLSWRGAPGELLDNVNRWRDQMQLPNIGPDALDDFTHEVPIGDATMIVVDLQGRFSGDGKVAPFAGGGPFSGGAPGAGAPDRSELPPGHPPIGGERTADAELPPGHPPIAGERTADAAPLTFDAPGSWQTKPASGMRKAAFDIAEGDQQAEMTVIDFPHTEGPSIADPLENVNRWRGEVGLAPVQPEALDESVETIPVSGEPATYVEIIPDRERPEESLNERATLAAMVTAADRIWFFKMTGSRDLVAAERDNFKSFLKSVRFTSGDGADNGY